MRSFIVICVFVVATAMASAQVAKQQQQPVGPVLSVPPAVVQQWIPKQPIGPALSAPQTFVLPKQPVVVKPITPETPSVKSKWLFQTPPRPSNA
jgi:hypothetical protein